MTHPSADDTVLNDAGPGSAGQAVTLDWTEMLDWLDVGQLGLGPAGDPMVPLVFVDLDASPAHPGSAELAALISRTSLASRRVAEGGVGCRLGLDGSVWGCSRGVSPPVGGCSSLTLLSGRCS
jgi:hypothetical protein